MFYVAFFWGVIAVLAYVFGIPVVAALAGIVGLAVLGCEALERWVVGPLALTDEDGEGPEL